MITLPEIFADIESTRFSVNLGLASSDAVFVTILEQSASSQGLRHLVATDPATVESVLVRVRLLAAAEVDKNYRHPGDMALAAYVWALRFNPGAVREARRLAETAMNVHWAIRLAKRTAATGELVAMPGNQAGFVNGQPVLSDGLRSGLAKAPALTALAAAAGVAFAVTFGGATVEGHESSSFARDSKPSIPVVAADGAGNEKEQP